MLESNLTTQVLPETDIIPADYELIGELGNFLRTCFPKLPKAELYFIVRLVKMLEPLMIDGHGDQVIYINGSVAKRVIAKLDGTDIDEYYQPPGWHTPGNIAAELSKRTPYPTQLLASIFDELSCGGNDIDIRYRHGTGTTKDTVLNVTKYLISIFRGQATINILECNQRTLYRVTLPSGFHLDLGERGDKPRQRDEDRGGFGSIVAEWLGLLIENGQISYLPDDRLTFLSDQGFTPIYVLDIGQQLSLAARLLLHRFWYGRVSRTIYMRQNFKDEPNGLLELLSWPNYVQYVVNQDKQDQALFTIRSQEVCRNLILLLICDPNYCLRKIKELHFDQLLPHWENLHLEVNETDYNAQFNAGTLLPENSGPMLVCNELGINLNELAQRLLPQLPTMAKITVSPRL